MIKIHVKPVELFNDTTQEFVLMPEKEFRFEHSLKSISKWEEKYCIPFLSNVEKLTPEQAIDYFYYMCLDDDFDRAYITNDVITLLNDYLTKKCTATTISDNGGKNKQILTSELIYAYIAIAGMPFEVETWNLQRLMMTLSCISILNNPDKKKKSKDETLQDYRKLNAQRLAQYNTKG